MKKVFSSLAFLIVALGAEGMFSPIYAQENAQEATVAVEVQPAVAGQTGTPEQILTELKASNAAILEKQRAVLERLKELELQAEQLRIFSKRG